MMTKCENCKKFYYSIYITEDYKRLCGKCYDKVRKDDPKFDPDDLNRREGC